jgi:hypothetical protein
MPARRIDPLTEACNRLLLDWLPAGLKSAVAAAYRHGASPACILAHVKVAIVRMGPAARHGGQLTTAAVEAYLEELQRDEPRC